MTSGFAGAFLPRSRRHTTLLTDDCRESEITRWASVEGMKWKARSERQSQVAYQRESLLFDIRTNTRSSRNRDQFRTLQEHLPWLLAEISESCTRTSEVLSSGAMKHRIQSHR